MLCSEHDILAKKKELRCKIESYSKKEKKKGRRWISSRDWGSLPSQAPSEGCTGTGACARGYADALRAVTGTAALLEGERVWLARFEAMCPESGCLLDPVGVGGR